MPLVRIDLIKGKSQEYRSQAGAIIYRMLVEILGVPTGDCFQVIAEHAKEDQPFDRNYLGIHRSDDCMFIQITLNEGRSVELKQRFYMGVTDALHEELNLRREDVLLSLVEVPKENWSYGNGAAQYVAPQSDYSK
jgi:4-oxalocrotonate tautomerase